MEKDLKNYFVKLGLSEDEIEQLINICPGLDMLDFKSAFECIKAVVAHGYPECDLDFLLNINPSILMYNPKDLNKILDKYPEDEFEDIIKADPFII